MMHARLILPSFYLFMSGCFQMPVSSQGRVSVLDDAPRIVASTSSGENKSVARIDAASKVALRAEAPAGNLSGSSIMIPSGALAISADLVIEEAIPLAQTSVTSSLQLDSDLAVKTVGAGLIIRPTASVNLSQPLTIAMPLDPTLALWAQLRSRLHLQGEKTYAVFYKQFVSGELRAGVIPTSDISFPEDGTAVFSGYFGSYWLAEVSKAIETKQEIKTDEPMVNIAQVAVIEKSGIVEEETIQTKTAIPVLVWAKPILSADAASRTFSLKASLAGSGDLSECFADLFPSQDAQTGLNLKVQADLTVSYKIESTLAYTFVGRMRCLDGQGRQTVSEWSESVSLLALKPAILSRAPLVVKTGELVTLAGQNFRRSMTVMLNGQVVKDLQILSENLATFIVPGNLDFGLASVAFAQDGTSQTVSLIYQASQDELPIIMLPPNEVCAGRSYYDRNGKLMTGGKVCEAAAAACTADGQIGCVTTSVYKSADTSQLTSAKVLKGITVAGVAGSITAEFHNDCTADGQAGCVAMGPGFAAALRTGAAAKILSGQTLAGIPGAVTLPALANVRAIDTVNGASGTLLDCSANAAIGCVTNSTYKAADLVNLSAANIKAGASIAGQAGAYPSAAYPLTGADATNDLAGFGPAVSVGTYEFFDSAGARYTGTLDDAGPITPGTSNQTVSAANTFYRQLIVAGDSDLAAVNIKNSIALFGVTGSLTGAPANCVSDGQDNCMTDGTNYKAAALIGAADKILAGQTLAGVAGTITLPAVGKVLTATSYGVSGTGSTGTLTLPSAANVLTGSAAYGEPASQLTPSYSPDFPALANVRDSDTVNGVTGTLADCGSDGSAGCVVVGPTYAALLKTGAQNKILSGNTIGSVPGNVTLPAATKVLTATSYGVSGTGSTGTLTLPAASNVLTGSGAYGEPGSQLTPSYSPDFPTLANVRTIDTVNGAAGTLADCSAGNQADCVANATYKTMNLSAAGTDTGLTAANFNARAASAAASEFWDATGTRHSITGDADLTAANVKATTVILGVTGQYPSASFPLASSTATTDLTLFNTQLTVDGGFEFFDSTGARYTGSGDSDLLSSNIKNAVSIESLSLTGNYLASWTCPTGWIKVPGDSAYGTGDFCVMKYEAKNVSTVATSQAASTPWVSITQTASITACRALGTGYDLISNPQWMTIGANVAGINGNWSGGTVGSASLFAGHNDNSPASACAAPSNDTDFYVETNCVALSSGDTAEQRRTLTLSNSNVIWDLSGNVSEWVNYTNRGDKPGATGALYEYTAVTGTTTTALKDLVPTNAVKAFWSDAWNSGKWIGQYYPGTNGSGGALLRGGNWNAGSTAGVFTAFLNEAPSASYPDIGFRCGLSGPTP